MAFISFTKAADPAAPDDLRINATAVLCVEASRPEMIGRTMIHMRGQGPAVNAVADSVGTVISAILGVMSRPPTSASCVRTSRLRPIFGC